ncbi:glycosyltransferase family 4 protein [Exilibacterium tricleocarpae]|uniref:Glycosyltransferase family 4 protein n=1 Tax=Exilibacterium tricleocarpae TaxID=2591008 RepID=A0A545T3E9_9GAMM|nr:glycosyltransferase family 4 protein [Exilibacterium tricleocarpae]TQV71747.1 glycosyltransferase family 4 protein [Exilibacterium tricleocarpae]
MSSILCFFHCESNTGYAIQRHEYVFAHAAYKITQDWDKIHFAYPSLARGQSDAIPTQVSNFAKLDFASTDTRHLQEIETYIRDNRITTAIGFDQPVHRKSYKYMRRGGVTKFMSYWGAPMSSLNTGIKLLLKRLQVSLIKDKPDLFVFQSQGMRKTAVYGRGIPFPQTYVVRSGINISKYIPDPQRQNQHVYELFDIPKDRKIIYYSGHMEARKGVAVIVRAAVELVARMGRQDVHFLFFGNQPGEEKAFDSIYKGTPAESHITFGGYRSDLEKILPSCYAGVLATTGWDSYPMSTIEIGASGLPLLVSDLLGVRETVLNGKTGLRFPVGDHVTLAEKLEYLLDNEPVRNKLGALARKRIESKCSREQQVARFVNALASI